MFSDILLMYYVCTIDVFINLSVDDRFLHYFSGRYTHAACSQTEITDTILLLTAI